MKPMEGLLENDKEMKLRVSFLPTEKGMLKYCLPLLIYNEEKKEYVHYSEIQLHGEGD